ncbi:unnamed protein product, partial [Tuber aestivum]
MPGASRIPIKILLSQLSKRAGGESRVEDNDDGKSPVAIVGLAVAVLTLLVGIVSLRSSRFRLWVSHLLHWSFIKKTLGITPPDHTPTVITAKEGSRTIPVAEIHMPSPVFIYNNYSNAPLIGTNSGIFSCSHSWTAGEAGTVSQAVELLGPGGRRPVSTEIEA